MEILSLEDLLKLMSDKNASDLHLQVGAHPALRINGEIFKLAELPPMVQERLKNMIYELLTEKDIARFESTGSLDTAFGMQDTGRFRISVFRQRGTIALIARRIAQTVPDFKILNLPESTADIANFVNGLVLVTGATGCGKSTTLAAIINHINKTRNCHILCIEDPIEYLYKNEKAVITQREVGVDVISFKDALKYAVRQDPDVILAGEIRDSDTVEFALHSAEIGNLVLGTLHSSNASQTIGRLLNFFPPADQSQVRKSIAANLRAIISQALLPSCKETVPLVPACEIMITNSTISRLITENMDEKILRAIKGGVKEGMQDFERAFLNLVNEGFITEETALQNAENPEAMKMKLKGIFLSEDGGIIG